MYDDGNGNGTRAGTLTAPVRNSYFYGKLLDVPHLELEQRYFLERRRMLNRLALGWGVLCGLEVRVAGERLVLGPGVAIDDAGREIVVDAAHAIDDPLALTDACGVATGEISERGPVVLSVCYHECPADPSPVLVSDCEVRESCAPGAIRERYRLTVRQPDDVCPPRGLTREQCAGIFGARPGADGGYATHAGRTGPREIGAAGPALDRLRDDIGAAGADRASRALRDRICRTLDGSCGEPHGCCVPIALVGRDADGRLVADGCAVRTRIYSNETLLDLILCLAERVEECCGGRPAQSSLPVVLATAPTPGATLTFAELGNMLGVETGGIAVTFDRKMDAGRLADPDPWLRFWVVMPPDANDQEEVVRMDLVLDRTTDQPFAGSAGFTAVYRLKGGQRTAGVMNRRVAMAGNAHGGAAPGGAAPLALRVLVQIRADDAATQIVDEESPPVLLDADCAGTGVSAAVLDKLWPEVETVVSGLWAALPPAAAGVLPSGDGTAGGRFHSSFEVTA